MALSVARKADVVQPLDYRMFAVIDVVGYLGTIVHLALIPVFFWLGFSGLAMFNMASSTTWILAWHANRRAKHTVAVTMMTIEVIAHTVLVVSVIGWQPGFQYYLMCGIPFTLFGNRSRTHHVLIFAAFMGVAFCALYLFTLRHVPAFMPPEIVIGMHLLNAGIAFAAIGIASYHFRDASMNAEQRMAELAGTDPLTGLHNRRHMRELLEQESARAARNGGPLAVVLTDIDHFKEFNDTYGHDCGDMVLRAVAEVMTARLRRTDTVARWGGEEFLLLLPDTTPDGALQITEGLRRAVADHRFPFHGLNLAVTMTFGVGLGRGADPIDDVLQRADTMLYAGKKAGRNRVMCEEPPGGRVSGSLSLFPADEGIRA